jgi:hypothetical protein
MGLAPVSKTIGMVVFAAFAASAAGVVVAAITAYLLMNQICHPCRQPIAAALRPTLFDRHVLAINVAGFA